MKDGKKMFVLFETVLAVLVFTLAFLMLRGSGEKNVPRISVIIRNPDDDQWSAFRYGLRMAAQDQGAELFVVSTGETMTVAEEQEAIEREIENRADAVIVQPVFGDDSEEMLRRAGKKVPVLLVEDTVREEGKICPFPVIKPDDASMGRALAEELLKDFSGGLGERTIGILMETAQSVSVTDRLRGFSEALGDQGAGIVWSVSGSRGEEGEMLLKAQPEVDFVIAMDDSSLATAGKCASANDLHGALVYGIAGSTEAVYYLDTGVVQCLVVPDAFSAGYQSLTAAVESAGGFQRRLLCRTVAHTVLRRENLFSEKNQEILYTMSQ